MNNETLLREIEQWLRLAQAQLMSEPVGSDDRNYWRDHISFIQSLKRGLKLGELVITDKVNVNGSPDSDDTFEHLKSRMHRQGQSDNVIVHRMQVDPGVDDKTVIGFVVDGAIKQKATPAQIAEAVSLHTGISRSAAIQIVYQHPHDTLKTIVRTALQRYGQTLAVGGTREKDADWYANSVIDNVFPLIEKQLGLV